MPEISLLDPRTLTAIEAGLVAIAIAIALLWPRRRLVPVAGHHTAPRWLSDQPYAQALIVLVLAVGLRAALLPILGPPVPIYPDEFSIILQGETFASGRLVNPTHPLFPFFETFYVNHLPSYASMYFPGRGLPLALGVLFFGEAWAGVWLSMILLAVATVWMLRGWVSGGLALVGGLLVVIRFGVVSGWINSYYGGGPVALGGVLVIGAFPRLLKAPRWRDGAALGLGLALLMISRPYEGFLFAAPVLALGGWELFRKLRRGEGHAVVRTLLPTVVLTGAGALLLLAHNQATTGDIARDPYSLNRASYAYAPAFLFADAHRPAHPVPEAVSSYYRAEAEPHDRRNSLSGLLKSTVEKVKGLLRFYVGWAMLIPFLIGLFAARKYPVLLLSGASLVIGFLAVTWDWTQYGAPAFGAIMVLIMIGFGRLRHWRFRGRPSGTVLSVLLVGIVILMMAIPVTLLVADAPRPLTQPFDRVCCAVTTTTPRSMIIDQLTMTPGRDLVLVRYHPDQMPWITMVSNAADIDEADIVWAHDLGAANERLLAYYPDRKVWIVEGVKTVSLQSMGSTSSGLVSPKISPYSRNR